ncbi:ADP-ribose pyrophosphatase [Levilactobacillus senmaizukei DSM 21775 = NBRC 103853]|uniref:ADP-ribose pyrophosphatase n=1 Tax=Levilactobacillus senmaizukei DSM 21775 = NBRC 103853 TaxID=1423803 RepID=A0A0R2DEU7_9LACO|nr:NUDIX domain-containing protein [Levilactobacillus senmaizukei]KRN02529.1 ADP-ribose pyrophosphatase [Levilactobacillus senmaizukei DSM 21775 = NBRC 103853]
MGYVLNLRQQIGQKPIIVVGAAAIVRDDQPGLLLVKRLDNRLWGLPAGSKELDESTEQTVLRELTEETGLVGQDPQLLTIASGQDMQYVYPNGDQIDSVTVVYELTASGQLQADQQETSVAKFVALTELKRISLTPLTKKILTDLQLVK